MYVNGRLISRGIKRVYYVPRALCRRSGRSETQQSIPPRQTRLEKGGAAYGDGRAHGEQLIVQDGKRAHEGMRVMRSTWTIRAVIALHGNQISIAIRRTRTGELRGIR